MKQSLLLAHIYIIIDFFVNFVFLFSTFFITFHLSHLNYYRPQRSWGKVIFSETCVKNSVHRGGMHGKGGHAWPRGACQGGMHGMGACMAGGVCGEGHVWQGGHACWGCAWQGVCMAGGGHAWQILQDTVNEQAVHILLECILVYYMNFS